MSSNLKEAVIKTLSYADIFDYPLKLSEIRKYLIGVKLSGKNWPYRFKKTISQIPQIKVREGYYFFKSRHNIVSIRLKRFVYSKEKMELARKIAGLMFYIPSILMIAVSGNLALSNADKEDDIDFLI